LELKRVNFDFPIWMVEQQAQLRSIHLQQLRPDIQEGLDSDACCDTKAGNYLSVCLSKIERS
jgi:hypothetical protein